MIQFSLLEFSELSIKKEMTSEMHRKDSRMCFRKDHPKEAAYDILETMELFACRWKLNSELTKAIMGI